MRTLEDFKVNPANDILRCAVLDSPGAGGANHHYQISGFSLDQNPSSPSLCFAHSVRSTTFPT